MTPTHTTQKTDYLSTDYISCRDWDLADTMKSLDTMIIDKIIRLVGMCAACTYSVNGIDCTLDDAP